MGLFKGSKHQKQVDDRADTVNDFVRQTPFWNYRPVDYRIDEYFLTGLKAELDSYLERLLAGDIDDGNGDVLDNIICDHAAKALKELADQKVQHEDLIINMYHQAEGTKGSLEKHLRQMTERREEISKELEAISSRCESEKFVRQ